ncbi:hypothetical protein N2W54_001391 [Lotmaria passim]
MSQPLSQQQPLSTSSDGLPEWCTEEFRERYRRGEVPQFGCYDPVYMHQSVRETHASSGLPSSSFFPPFSSLVRQHAKTRDVLSSTEASMVAAAAEDETPDEADGLTFGRARPAHSWVHITPAEDLWNGPPLTTKIPPASDYERILLDRT